MRKEHSCVNVSGSHSKAPALAAAAHASACGRYKQITPKSWRRCAVRQCIVSVTLFQSEIISGELNRAKYSNMMLNIRWLHTTGQRAYRVAFNFRVQSFQNQEKHKVFALHCSVALVVTCGSKQFLGHPNSLKFRSQGPSFRCALGFSCACCCARCSQAAQSRAWHGSSG